MDNHAHIRSLIDKLLKDDLSVHELEELQELFRSEQVPDEIDLWLKDLWRSSVRKEEVAMNPDLMYHRLETLIGKKGPDVKEPGKNPFIYRFVYPAMRYAVVFILAVAVSWFFFRDGGSESTGYVVAESGASEVSVTYGSKTRIVLPDSSVVFLNSGSKLNYAAGFTDRRHVELDGEGYFIVKPDSLHPFYVHTSDISIKALGTEFNVKAYPEEKNVETLLVNGVVEILKFSSDDNYKSIMELVPGEKATFVRPSVQIPNIPNHTGQAQMIVHKEPKPDITIGWVQNQLVFDAEPFEEVAIKLERWFNVSISIRNDRLRMARLSGRYDNENIEQVMHSLQLIIPFGYKMEKNQIIIN